MTVQLTKTPTAGSVKEMTMLVRLIGQVDVSYDVAGSSFSLKGYENHLGLASWLLHAAEIHAANTERPAARRALREKIRLTTNTQPIFDKTSPPAIVGCSS